MRHKHGCGPRGRFEFNIPEALFAMSGPGGRRGSWGPFSFDFGEGDGWGDRPRGRRRTQLASDDLRLLLLYLISDKPRHGYDLIKAVEQLTDGQYAPSPGVVYPMLTMLQDMGHIEEVPEEGARKTYQATAEGRRFLEEQAEEIPELLERLDAMGGRQRRAGGGAHIGRAVGNLMNALRNRVAHEGWDEALVHEITDILDEAAQRIERLK